MFLVFCLKACSYTSFWLLCIIFTSRNAEACSRRQPQAKRRTAQGRPLREKSCLLDYNQKNDIRHMADRGFMKRMSRHQAWLVPLLIFLAAFAIRLVYLNQIKSLPTFGYPIMDEKYHVEVAQKIASGEGPDNEPYYRAPLYPYFLAALYRATGGSLYWSRFIQILLASFLPLIVFLFGLKLFDRRIAYWSSAIAVFYPTFLYYDASLLITSSMVLLTALLTWQLYYCQGRGPINFVIAGVLLGLAGLARPNILLLGPALLVWVWLVVKPLVGWKKALVRYLLIGAACLAVILPVTVRNYAVSDDFVLIAWQGGFNFFLGNNRQSTGWSATTPGIDQTWEGGYKQAIAVAEHSAGRLLRRSEVSGFWYGQAWEEIKKSPASFLALQIKKIRLFLNGYEIPNNQDMYLARQFAPILRPLMFNKVIYFPYGLLAPLAAIGLALSLAHWRRYMPIYLVLFSYIVSLLLFFVCARYRQPLIPFLILFAVYAVIRVVEFIRKKEGKNVAVFVAVLTLLVVESNHDMLGLDPKRTEAENHLLLGNAYLQQRKLAKAEDEFRQTVDSDPTFAQGYNNLGLLAANRRQLTQAAEYFRKALALDPTTIETHFNLATTYLDRGDTESAIGILERARQTHPLDDFLHLKLGMTYYEAGRIDDARRSVEQSLRLNPQSDLARQVYRQILETATDTTSP